MGLAATAGPFMRLSPAHTKQKRPTARTPSRGGGEGVGRKKPKQRD